MMYPNLRAEMARRSINNEVLSKVLQIDINTVSRKLNNPRLLKYYEAVLIKKTLFPELGLEYLFNTAE